MSVFEQYDSSFFNNQIGDSATTIVSGKLFCFYGILKHDNIPAFDTMGKAGYLAENTTMTVLTSVADDLDKGLNITVNSIMWTIQEKRLQSDGHLSLLVLSRVRA